MVTGDMVEVEVKETPKVEKPRWNKGYGGWDVDEKGARYWRLK